jgi:protein LTV1
MAAREKAKEYAREYEARPQRDGLPDAPVRHFDDDPQERWDCESVLSLRSNLENHPGKISEPNRRGKPGGAKIHLSAKTGLPIVRETTDGSSSSEGSETFSVATTSVARRKGESKEEKKARKGAVKEAQRAARANKKELKMMFKEQEAKIGKMAKTHCTVPL